MLFSSWISLLKKNSEDLCLAAVIPPEERFFFSSLFSLFLDFFSLPYPLKAPLSLEKLAENSLFSQKEKKFYQGEVKENKELIQCFPHIKKKPLLLISPEVKNFDSFKNIPLYSYASLKPYEKAREWKDFFSLALKESGVKMRKEALAPLMESFSSLESVVSALMLLNVLRKIPEGSVADKEEIFVQKNTDSIWSIGEKLGKSAFKEARELSFAFLEDNDAFSFCRVLRRQISDLLSIALLMDGDMSPEKKDFPHIKEWAFSKTESLAKSIPLEVLAQMVVDLNEGEVWLKEKRCTPIFFIDYLFTRALFVKKYV